MRRCDHAVSRALQPSCREPPLPVTARTCTPRKLPPRHRPATALPMRTCYPSNIGGNGMRAPPPASENSVAAENTTSAAEASASPLVLRKAKIPVASLQRAPVGSYWTAFLGCRRVHWRAGRRKVLLLGIEKFRPFRWVHQAKQPIRLLPCIVVTLLKNSSGVLCMNSRTGFGSKPRMAREGG